MCADPMAALLHARIAAFGESPMRESADILPAPVDTGGPGQPLLIVRDLKKHFPLKKGILGRAAGAVQAVDDVSFDVQKGETLGIVGESGCGKSTTSRLIMALIDPTCRGSHLRRRGRSARATCR